MKPHRLIVQTCAALATLFYGSPDLFDESNTINLTVYIIIILINKIYFMKDLIQWPVIKSLFLTPIKFINLMANYKFSCDENKVSNENIVRVINLLINIEKEQENENSSDISANYIDAINQIIHFLKLAVKYYQFFHLGKNSLENTGLADDNKSKKIKEEEVMNEEIIDEPEELNVCPVKKNYYKIEKDNIFDQNIISFPLRENLDSLKISDKDDDKHQCDSSPILNYYENKLKTETDILNDISLKKQELIKRVQNLKKEMNSEKSSLKKEISNKPTYTKQQSGVNSFYVPSSNIENDINMKNMKQNYHNSQTFEHPKTANDYLKENNINNIAEYNIQKGLKEIKKYKQNINKMLFNEDRKVNIFLIIGIKLTFLAKNGSNSKGKN